MQELSYRGKMSCLHSFCQFIWKANADSGCSSPELCQPEQQREQVPIHPQELGFPFQCIRPNSAPVCSWWSSQVPITWCGFKKSKIIWFTTLGFGVSVNPCHSSGTFAKLTWNLHTHRGRAVRICQIVTAIMQENETSFFAVVFR